MPISKKLVFSCTMAEMTKLVFGHPSKSFINEKMNLSLLIAKSIYKTSSICPTSMRVASSLQNHSVSDEYNNKANTRDNYYHNSALYKIKFEISKNTGLSIPTVLKSTSQTTIRKTLVNY